MDGDQEVLGKMTGLSLNFLDGLGFWGSQSPDVHARTQTNITAHSQI